MQDRIGVITQFLGNENWVILPIGRIIFETENGKKDVLSGLERLDGNNQSALCSILFFRAKVVASTREDTLSLLKILLT